MFLRSDMHTPPPAATRPGLVVSGLGSTKLDSGNTGLSLNVRGPWRLGEHQADTNNTELDADQDRLLMAHVRQEMLKWGLGDTLCVRLICRLITCGGFLGVKVHSSSLEIEIRSEISKVSQYLSIAKVTRETCHGLFSVSCDVVQFLAIAEYQCTV